MARTRRELAAFHGATVPDLVGGRPPTLVFVGINPSLMTAATGTHFAHPSNRWYPALHRAGLTTSELPRGVAHTPQQRAELTDRGIAITNVVARATARAAELTEDELVDGARVLTERIAAWRPRVVAMAGVTAYRTAFGRRRAVAGRQEHGLAGAQLWVVPNPSGLNQHERIDTLAAWYGRVADAAGVRRQVPTPGSGG